MEFTVKRNLLLNELILVQGVIEKKSTIPILSNILLEASGDAVGITATDLDVSICCGCAAEVHASGTLTVSARRLFDIVRLLPDESEIHCKLLENDWVKLRAGKSDYKVVGLPRENFPSVPQAPPGGITLPGNDLKAMIQRTMFAITQEESRYSLNGALLVLGPHEMRMVATDGHRLALVAETVDIEGVDGEIRTLIHRKTLFGKALFNISYSVCESPDRNVEEQQGNDDSYKTDAIQQETYPFTNGSNGDSRNSRAYQPGTVKKCRIQGDGVTQVFGIIDQVDHQ